MNFGIDGKYFVQYYNSQGPRGLALDDKYTYTQADGSKDSVYSGSSAEFYFSLRNTSDYNVPMHTYECMLYKTYVADMWNMYHYDYAWTG